MSTWPSSPPNPLRPLTTASPDVMTPPPSPVPMIAEIDVASVAGTEDRDVAPERRRVAIVEIDDATAELLFEAVDGCRSPPNRRERNSSSRGR